MVALFGKISPAAARLQSLLHRHGSGLAFEAGGRRWQADFAPRSATSHGATVYATLGDGEFTLWLNQPDWLVAAGTALDLAPDLAAHLPEQLLRAGLECFVADLLAALERATGLPAALTRLEPETSAPLRSACSFALRRDDGLALAGAWTTADRPGNWRAALEKALANRLVPPRRLPDDLPLPATVAVGLWRAPAAKLTGLAPGDVVLSPAGPERVVTLGNAWRFAARLEKGVLSVEGKTMTSAAAPAAAPAPAAAAGGAAKPSAAPEAQAQAVVDAVEVELQAQVGSLTISLAQLKQLGAGQIVEFSTPVESPATLLVGGRAVAVGELVDVGGRVGVRITAMRE